VIFNFYIFCITKSLTDQKKQAVTGKFIPHTHSWRATIAKEAGSNGGGVVPGLGEGVAGVVVSVRLRRGGGDGREDRRQHFYLLALGIFRI